MGQQGINYFYTGVLGLNQDSLRVFYDFNSGDSNHLLSIPIGNAEHSGLINGNSGDFFGDLGSGNFYNKSVKIANSTGIFSNTATFIVTQEKTGQNGGTIFSNFEDNSFKSGYYFGINDANKFYWGYDNNGNPSIKTSLKNLSDKNAWALKLENNSVSFCYYNNNTLQLEKESWAINSTTLLPSDQWYVGSGKNLKPYDHFIDNFIYIDRSISDSNLTRLFSGIWNDASGNFSQYLPYETGQITGYTNTITGITGILSTSQVFSGNFTGTSTVEVYTISGLTGTILEGGTELQFLQNLPQYCVGRDEQPIYWEKNVDIETTGITGYQRYLSGTRDVNVVTPVYIQQNETGYISSGTTSVPLYNTGDPADFLTSGQIVTTPNYPYLNSFGMKSVSYIGLPQTGYFESLSVTGNPLQTYYNKIAQYNFGQLNFQTDKAYNSGQVDIFKDGLIQSTGGYTITGEFFNGGVLIAKDYYISGRNIYFAASSSSNQVIYDTNNTGNKFYAGGQNIVYYSGEPVFYSGELVYYGSGIDYSSSGTLPIEVSSNLFFLNGRKLVSGVDYSGLNGFFAATNYTQSISGEIRSLEIRPDQIKLAKKYSSGECFDLIGAAPNPKAVFSFRKVNPNYTGFCCDLKRAIDNQTSGIRFKNGYVDFNSMESFCGTGNGYMSGWYDQGPQGFKVSGEGSLPLLVSSGSVVTGAIFNESKLFSSNNFGLSSGDAMTTIFNANLYNNDTYTTLWSQNDFSSFNCFAVGVRNVSGIRAYTAIWNAIGSFNDDEEIDLNRDYSLAVYTPTIRQQATGGAYFWIDGSGVGSAGTSTSKGNLVDKPLCVGGFGNLGGSYWDGKINEILIYDSNITGQIPSISENMSQFWANPKPCDKYFQINTGTFLRGTSINWLNGVRISKDKFLEHGSVDLINGSQILTSGNTGFFINNTDFWN